MATFVPMNYSEAQEALRQARELAVFHNKKVEQAVANLRAAATSLERLDNAYPEGWLDAKQYTDTQAADSTNAGDEEWQKLKREWDKLVADFTAMRDRAIAVRDAADAQL